MSIKIVNNEAEFNEIIEKGVTLVDFYAAWCGPCKMLAPFVEEVAEQYEGSVNVCKVNVDEVDVLAYKYNIRSIPTLMYFKDGELKETHVGFQDKNTICKNIEKYLG